MSVLRHKQLTKVLISSEAGYSSVYFSLISLVFIGIFVLCAVTLMRLYATNELLRQTMNASRVVLSYYKDDLENQYGLLAYDLDAIDAKTIFDPYVDGEWRLEITKTFQDLSAFQHQAVAIAKISLLEKGAELIDSTANEETQKKANLDKETFDETSNALEQSESINHKDKLSEREESNLTDAEKERARRLKTLLEAGVRKDWALKSGGEVSLKVFENRFRFNPNSATAQNPVQKALMAEYVLGHFNHYLDIHKSEETNKLREGSGYFHAGEVEYILEGNPSAIVNQRTVVLKIFLMREGTNLVHLLKSKSKMEYVATSSALIGGLFPVSIPAVKAGLIALWSGVESVKDVSLLIEGEKIPMLKLKETEWYTDLESSASKQDETHSKSSSKIDYKGYLRLMLIAQNHQVTALRSMELIDLNTSKIKAIDWSKLVVAHRIWMKGKTGKEMRFEEGYFPIEEPKGKSEH